MKFFNKSRTNKLKNDYNCGVKYLKYIENIIYYHGLKQFETNINMNKNDLLFFWNNGKNDELEDKVNKLLDIYKKINYLTSGEEIEDKLRKLSF